MGGAAGRKDGQGRQATIGALCLLKLAAASAMLAASPADPAYEAAAQAYHAARTGRLDEAVRLMDGAIAKTPTPVLRRQRILDLAQWLERIGRNEEAARHYEQAARIAADARIWKAAGYAYLRSGRQALRLAALAAFRQAAALSPDEAALWRQIGYLHKALGHRRAALTAFRRAWKLLPVAVPDEQVQSPPAVARRLLAREIADLSDRWQGSLEFVWRANAPRAAPVVLSERSLTSSQLNFSLARRFGTFFGIPRVRVFARLLAAPRPGEVLPRRDSVQAGVGVSWQPLTHRNLLLTLERLVRIGRFARNDVMLRAAWSTGDGYVRPADGRRNWPFWSIYLDGALIDPASPDLLGNAQARVGRAWAFERLTLAPQFAINFFAQHDAFGAVSLLQAEPGLELRWSVHQPETPRPPQTLALALSFQKKVLGSSRNNRGLALRLSWRF